MYLLYVRSIYQVKSAVKTSAKHYPAIGYYLTMVQNAGPWLNKI